MTGDRAFRGRLAVVGLFSVGLLVLAVALGPALVGQPAASPEPVAQATPTPAPTSSPPSPAPPTTPPPSPSPTPPQFSLQPVPPDSEIYPDRPGSWAYRTPEPAPDPSIGRPFPPPVPAGTSGVVVSRVVFPLLRIDLPVVSGELQVRGNRNNYPLCDVAQYLTYFVQPPEEGTTYVYSHAQRGMFLPMLRASRRNNGAEMIGAQVEIYTNDGKKWVYEIYRVKRHSTDLNIGYNVDPGEQRLILQTSEGPPGHRPVLQVAARPLEVFDVSEAEANPSAKPRVCLPPR